MIKKTRRKGLKICIISSYPPNRGRLSEYTKYLALNLADRVELGQIVIIADRVHGRKNHVVEEKNIEVYRMWQPDNPLSFLAILPFVIRLRPDVVHFNIHFQSFGKSRISNFFGLCLAPVFNIFGYRVLCTVHNFGDIVDLDKVNVENHFVNRLAIFVVTKFLLSLTAVVVTVRSYIDRLDARYGSNNIRFIPHGASVERIPENGSKNILMFGHMGPYKGLPVLLNSFKEIRKLRKDVNLIIAGTSHPNFPGFIDSYRENCEDVIFTGYVPEEKLSDLFSVASVVVLPYLTATGTSGVFHMACRFGRPVVASDLPEFRELIREGASAVLFPPGDHEYLRDSILRVLDDYDLALSIGLKNLEYASKESWEIVAEKYCEAYTDTFYK